MRRFPVFVVFLITPRTCERRILKTPLASAVSTSDQMSAVASPQRRPVSTKVVINARCSGYKSRQARR
jgi:hypothetical protein